MRRAFSLIAAALLMAGFGGSGVSDVSSGTVIRNVSVVNTRDGSVQPHIAVVVDGGKIVRIAASEYLQMAGSLSPLIGV